MGFLSGNLNYVRVPSTPYPQVDLIVQAIDEVLAIEEFGNTSGMVGGVDGLFRSVNEAIQTLVEMVGGVDGLTPCLGRRCHRGQIQSHGKTGFSSGTLTFPGLMTA